MIHFRKYPIQCGIDIGPRKSTAGSLQSLFKEHLNIKSVDFTGDITENQDDMKRITFPTSRTFSSSAAFNSVTDDISQDKFGLWK